MRRAGDLEATVGRRAREVLVDHLGDRDRRALGLDGELSLHVGLDRHRGAELAVEVVVLHPARVPLELEGSDERCLRRLRGEARPVVVIGHGPEARRDVDRLDVGERRGGALDDRGADEIHAEAGGLARHRGERPRLRGESRDDVVDDVVSDVHADRRVGGEVGGGLGRAERPRLVVAGAGRRGAALQPDAERHDEVVEPDAVDVGQLDLGRAADDRPGTGGPRLDAPVLGVVECPLLAEVEGAGGDPVELARPCVGGARRCLVRELQIGERLRTWRGHWSTSS